MLVACDIQLQCRHAVENQVLTQTISLVTVRISYCDLSIMDCTHFSYLVFFISNRIFNKTKQPSNHSFSSPCILSGWEPAPCSVSQNIRPIHSRFAPKHRNAAYVQPHCGWGPVGQHFQRVPRVAGPESGLFPAVKPCFSHQSGSGHEWWWCSSRPASLIQWKSPSLLIYLFLALTCQTALCCVQLTPNYWMPDNLILCTDTIRIFERY